MSRRRKADALAWALARRRPARNARTGDKAQVRDSTVLAVGARRRPLGGGPYQFCFQANPATLAQPHAVLSLPRSGQLEPGSDDDIAWLLRRDGAATLEPRAGAARAVRDQLPEGQAHRGRFSGQAGIVPASAKGVLQGSARGSSPLRKEFAGLSRGTAGVANRRPPARREKSRGAGRGIPRSRR
jgi:hypothetical protein